VVLGAPQLRRNRQHDVLALRLSKVVAGDFPARVWQRVVVDLTESKREVGEVRLLRRLALRRRERLLARIDAALREVPVAVGAQDQDAPTFRRAANRDNAGGDG
jgi:hypothetical protein